MKKYILLSALMMVCYEQLFAQVKLKSVQENSLFAPASVKIDGNLTEWNDNFQAYNKATKVFYILANDAKNLYLVVKSTDPTNIAKIEAGGVNIIINTADKKNDKDAFSITFPVSTRGARGGGGGGRGNGGGRGGRGGGGGVTLTDSAIKANTELAHTQFIAASKELKVLGFKDITDTLISIYNEYSIKTAIGYNTEGNFTYELAIPLKILGLSATAPKEFAYHITLNGIQLPNGGGFGGGGRGGRGGGGGGGRGGANIDYQDLISPTDFWAKYILAKK